LTVLHRVEVHDTPCSNVLPRNEITSTGEGIWRKLFFKILTYHFEMYVEWVR